MTCTYKRVPVVLCGNGCWSGTLSTCSLVYVLLFCVLSGKLVVY